MNHIAILLLLLVPLAGCVGSAPETGGADDTGNDGAVPPAGTPTEALPNVPVPGTNATAGHAPIELQGCDGTSLLVPVERSIIEERLPAGVTPLGSNPVTLVIMYSLACESAVIGNDRFVNDMSVGMVFIEVGNPGVDFFAFEAWADWSELLDLWRAQGLDPHHATTTVTDGPTRTVTIQGDGIHYTLREVADDVQDVGQMTMENVFLAGAQAQYAFQHKVHYSDNPSTPGTLAVQAEEGFLAQTFGPAGIAPFERQTSTQRFTWIETPLEENQ